MAEASRDLEGPDFEKGCEINKVPDGGMLLGHAFDEAILVARRGKEIFGIGATCTHYGGPLAKGLMVDCIVRCPWHHARFDLRTGEAIAAPALNDVSCWKIEKRGERFFVTGKIDKKPARKPKASPASVVIVGAGAAGSAAAEMLRREGYGGPITLIGADEFLPYDRPNLSKDYLAGAAPEEWIPLRPPEFYREQKIDALARLRSRPSIRKRNRSRFRMAVRWAMARCCWRPALNRFASTFQAAICRTFVICELSPIAGTSLKKRSTRNEQWSSAQASSGWKSRHRYESANWKSQWSEKNRCRSKKFSEANWAT